MSDYNDNSETPQDVAGDLGQFDDQFAGADEKPNDQRSIPDGTYNVRVDKCVLTRTKKSQVPMVSWTLAIIAGDFEGQRLFSNNAIQSDNNVRFLKKDFLTAGVNIPLGESLSENIVGYCEATLDKCMEVKQVTKGENTNIYFNRQVILSEGDSTEGSTDGDAPPATDPDDIPF